MEKEIKRITIINGEGTKIFNVENNKISKIEDKSIEYPDSIHIIYNVFDEKGKILHSIENCPVVVDYK